MGQNQQERIVAGFRITKEEVLESDPQSGRHHIRVTMRMCRVDNDAVSGWVSFYLNRENRVERRNAGGAYTPLDVLNEMYSWAGTILRGIARRMKQGVARKTV